jgi:hypothetical protein
MIHGTSDRQTSRRVGSVPAARGGGGIVLAESSWRRNAGEVHSSRGCQILRNPIRAAMQISEAPISTIHGLIKFEIKNWGIAKDTPQTRIAGQIWTIPRQPVKAQITQAGTINEKNGNWRPIIAPSR